MKAPDDLEGRRVWDAPVRVFHWSLVVCFAVAWLTREPELIDLHLAAGYTLGVLLLFRVGWGFAGSAPARFRSFVAAPSAALRYLRQTVAGSAPAYLSHNPAGAWSVLLFIALGLAQACTGPLLLSAQHGYGPLADRIATGAAAWLHELHEIGAWVMVGLLALHLAGVAVGSRAHGESLLAAMISGRKRHVPEQTPLVPRHGGVALAMIVALVVGNGAYLRASGWFENYATLRREAKAAGVPVAPPTWRDECGSCHLAYPPELLPARSWARLLDEQHQHFGEDLGLSDASLQTLKPAAAAADQGRHWAGLALRASVPARAAPQRISETGFWRERHEDVAEARFKSAPVSGRHNCEACHEDAASAIFAPRLIHQPEHISK